MTLEVTSDEMILDSCNHQDLGNLESRKMWVGGGSLSIATNEESIEEIPAVWELQAGGVPFHRHPIYLQRMRKLD